MEHRYRTLNRVPGKVFPAKPVDNFLSRRRQEAPVDENGGAGNRISATPVTVNQGVTTSRDFIARARDLLLLNSLVRA